ncbi:MAG TPA: CBS domain-containing protein [Solirubrobacteraceae bacterium]|nr:CBS domain-containing protein [Solirubrobacteraceae bacterium]
MTTSTTSQQHSAPVTTHPPTMDTATVRDVMHPGIVSCSGAAGAAEIARIMASCRVHSVAVLGLSKDERHTPHIWGIVSDLDVLAATTRPGAPATAADLASEPVITVRPTMSLKEAAEAMVRHGVHHVVVADPERHTPVGILSTLDIAEVLAREDR